MFYVWQTDKKGSRCGNNMPIAGGFERLEDAQKSALEAVARDFYEGVVIEDGKGERYSLSPKSV